MRKWLLIAVVFALVAVGIMAALAPMLSSIAREKIQTALQDRFDSDLQIKNLQVSLFPSVRVSGESMVFRRKGHREGPPLIEIARFTASGSVLGLLFRHVRAARLEGLSIHIPPKEPAGTKETASGSSPYFVIDEVIADGAKLTTIPRETWKEPLVFDIRTLHMHGVSSTSPLSFEAVLINAKPPGEIRSKGRFGPWQKQEPGETPVSGDYTFRDADLGVFKGIAGTLSSDGSYRGALNRIEVSGHTDVPNFMVTLAGNPVHLQTSFEATVNGTDGNTYLHPVTARFGESTIVANGSIEGKQGVRGKTVALEATVTRGRLEDMLRLGVHENEPPLTGAITFHSKIVIPPGKVEVVEKLRLDGAFEVATARFSKLNVQQKLDELSHRGKGKTDDAAAPSVAANFRGDFELDAASLELRNLSFDVPGVRIEMNGRYGLETHAMDFRGTARLDAKLSQTTTGIKSVLLKAVDPLFRDKSSKAGAVIPIKVSGTKDNPSFGLDLSHGGSQKANGRK